MLTFLTIFAALITALGVAIANLGFVSPFLGAAVSLVGIAVLSLLFFVALVKLITFGAKATNWMSFFFGLASFLTVCTFGYLHFMHPLHDISSNVRNPPEFLRPVYPFQVDKGSEFLDKSMLLNRDYNSVNAATQLLKYPAFEGQKLKVPGKDAYEETLRVIREQLPDWRVVLDDKEKLHAEFEVEWSPWRFVYDVVVEVRQDQFNLYESIVEMRSRSRLGEGDLGVNNRRLRDLKIRLLLASKALEDRLASARTEYERQKALSTTGGTPVPVSEPAPESAPAPAPPPPPAQPTAPAPTKPEGKK